MAKMILTAILIGAMSILVGCENNVDRSSAKLMLIHDKTMQGTAPTMQIATDKETDIVEQVAKNRQAYREGLGALINYYTGHGDNMKLTWAKKEMSALDAMPQYTYIVDAGLAGPSLRPTAAVPEADYLYKDGVELENKARAMGVFVDESMLRKALDKYNQVIRRCPTSDKIDDAAYKAAGIYEYFKDYAVAVLYYQRVYQWDANTTYPALFKAAYILDRQMHRYTDALEFYQQALKNPNLGFSYKQFAETRIAELTARPEGAVQNK
jgi:tetratricopeptide (TPR) repeat protein